MCGVFPGRPFVRAAPRRFLLKTPGCGASEVAKPGPPCPPTQGSLGAPAVGWGRGRRKRLQEALSPSPVGCPPRAARPRDHRSLPLPAHFPALRRCQSGAGRVPPAPLWAVPRGQASPARRVRRRPGRRGGRELSRAAAQRPRRPGTNISLCGGSEGRGGARGGGGRAGARPAPGVRGLSGSRLHPQG